MSSGLVDAVKRVIMKFIQYAIYWEKAQIKKISDKINVTKSTFFSKELQHSVSWKQKVHQFSKRLRGVSIFYSIWVLLKFIFIWGSIKNYESVNKGKRVFLTGFTPCKAEQLLQGMELQEKD